MSDPKRAPARIVLNTFGSFGDVHPYLALGSALRRRGHEVTIATMEIYRETTTNAGLEFAPVRPNIAQPREQDEELISRIMEPRTGPQFLMEQVVFPAVRDAYHDLLAATESADLLITHPAAPAGPLVGRKTGLPWISTVLAPLSFFSVYDPPIPPVMQWTTRVFSLLGPRFLKLFFDMMKREYKAKPVAEFRAELGLPDYGNPMFEGQHSPLRILALFSKVFGAPQPDWPPQTEITGFCFYDGDHDSPFPAELSDFLDSGPPPIVFTLGSSAVWVARDFYRESIEAARRLGQRAVLLIGDERNHPGELPAGMIAVNYVSYDLLLSRASVVVHHGGVGTTSHALRAGVPTLIVPFAFDQSDNAEHAQRLGVSRTVYRNQYRAARVATELSKLLRDPSYARRAAEVGEQIRQENGPARAADAIEQVLTDTRNQPEELAYASGD
ncbi:MAG TPA: glycosyltransferase [Pyrinomonadaceae bacterium]|nr:glycosyltransferase [Pyrinomonadaceae bacterium]